MPIRTLEKHPHLWYNKSNPCKIEIYTWSYKMKRVIGIRKSMISIGTLLVAFTFITMLVCTIMWVLYQSNFDIENISKYGKEVEATCTHWHSQTDYFSEHSYESYYRCYYIYYDDEGKYYSVTRRFYNREDAAAEIGKQITIVINPNGTDAWDCDLNFIKKLKLTYEKDLAIAIVFCFPIPFALYLLIYRGLYRSILNSKIRNEVGVSVYEKEEEEYSNLRKPEIDEPLKSYDPTKIKTGEVVKTRSWIVSYVKVKYTDNKGIGQIKWARSWFTRKEAKYLTQKKFINIVPYKNTYGILEELPASKN